MLYILLSDATNLPRKPRGSPWLLDYVQISNIVARRQSLAQVNHGKAVVPGGATALDIHAGIGLRTLASAALALPAATALDTCRGNGRGAQAGDNGDLQRGGVARRGKRTRRNRAGSDLS